MSLNIKDYLDLEAEEGSDNEEHDHKVKNILDKDEIDEENDDPNRNLEDLIDDCIAQTEKENKLLRNKFREEELAKDKEIINDVIEGNFKCKKRQWVDFKKEHSDLEDDNEDKKLQLKERKKIISCLMNNKETYSDSFNKNKKFINISKLKKQLDDFSELEGNNSEDNKEGESDLKELFYGYEKEMKKKISEQSSCFKRRFEERIKENDQILENVINLNKAQMQAQQTGKNRNQFLSFSSSQMSQNSMLHAIKKDKYYSHSQAMDKSQTNEGSSNKHQGNNVFPLFNKLNKNSLNSDKKNKISAIFNRGDVTLKVKMK
jgi:hypothetical protein